MARQVVLLGHDPSLATILRTLLDPDDRLVEVDELEGWQRLLHDEIDAVVVDLPDAGCLPTVEEVRNTYGGRLIVLAPTDDPVSVPSEYDCLVIGRPDIEALWGSTDNDKAAAASTSSELAEAGPTADIDPTSAGGSSADAEKSGTLIRHGQPPSSGAPFQARLEGLSTDQDSILLQMISAQRPINSNSSRFHGPLPTAPRREHDRDVAQATAVEIAEWIQADVVAVLLDNGEGLFEVSGGVGLIPADVRLDVEHSHDVMRELFLTSIRLIEDTKPVRRALAGIPGSHAETLLMAILVHDHNWFGVLIAGRNRSRSGIPPEVFSGHDVRALAAATHAATPALYAVALLRRLEWGLRTGKSLTDQPPPATVAEGSAAVSAPSRPPPAPPTLPAHAAPSVPPTQDAPEQAARSADAVDLQSGTTGRAAAMLVAYLTALAAVDLMTSSGATSVPVAVASHSLLALLLCVALRFRAGQSIAVLVPPLVAVSVIRLVTLGALPGDVSPLTRVVVVGVPALVAVAMATLQRSREWRLLRPHTGGWRGQLLVGLVGIPSALIVWAIAPPVVGVRGDASTIVAATVLVIFAALPDELLYRGLLVPAAAQVVGPSAVPFAAVTYALAFVTGGSVATVLLAFLLGIVLGWCRWLTGSVVGVIGAHSLLNVLVYLVLPASG